MTTPEINGYKIIDKKVDGDWQNTKAIYVVRPPRPEVGPGLLEHDGNTRGVLRHIATTATASYFGFNNFVHGHGDGRQNEKAAEARLQDMLDGLNAADAGEYTAVYLPNRV